MIPLSVAKKYMRLSRGLYKNLYNDFFHGNDRVYFPIEAGPDSVDSPHYDDIKDELESRGYEMIDYVKGTAKLKDGKNVLKIGRLLKQWESEYQDNFRDDPIRQGGMMVCISRHPYDIVGMTTGRKWTSCMRLEGGNEKYIQADILGGALVAYLISHKDKNLQNPMARALIKPYISASGKFYMVKSKKVYGIGNNLFTRKLAEIANRFNLSAPPDVYHFNHLHYHDGEIQKVDTRSAEEKIKHRDNRQKTLAEFRAKEYEKLKPFVRQVLDFIPPSMFAAPNGYLNSSVYSGRMNHSELLEFYSNMKVAMSVAGDCLVKEIWNHICTVLADTDKVNQCVLLNGFCKSSTVVGELTEFGWSEMLDIFAAHNASYQFIKVFIDGYNQPIGTEDEQNLVIMSNLEKFGAYLEGAPEVLVTDGFRTLYSNAFNRINDRCPRFEKSLVKVFKSGKTNLARRMLDGYFYNGNICELVRQEAESNGDETAAAVMKIYDC